VRTRDAPKPSARWPRWSGMGSGATRCGASGACGARGETPGVAWITNAWPRGGASGGCAQTRAPRCGPARCSGRRQPGRHACRWWQHALAGGRDHSALPRRSTCATAAMQASKMPYRLRHHDVLSRESQADPGAEGAVCRDRGVASRSGTRRGAEVHRPSSQPSNPSGGARHAPR
jgi:hypothetical protein